MLIREWTVKRFPVQGTSCGSEGDAGTVMFELAGQNASVQLVKLHELQQVSESRVSVVQTVEELAVIFNRYNLKVFDFLRMAQ